MWANAVAQLVTNFGTDPNTGGRQARGIVADIWQRVQGARTHPYGAAKADPSIAWNGVASDPQQFQSAGFLLGGGVPYKDGASADISSGLVEGPMGDPARRIFAQRLARRSTSGSIG